MKELIDRLMAMREEAESLCDKIASEFENGEILSSGMWGAKGNIDETIGTLLAQEYKAGNMTFQDRKDVDEPF